MRFSEHFEKERAGMTDRERISLALCEEVVDNPVSWGPDEGERTAYWGRVEERDKTRYLKVIVETDGEEIVTAHFDRAYRRKANRGELPG